jgi:hypothetical protein
VIVRGLLVRGYMTTRYGRSGAGGTPWPEALSERYAEAIAQLSLDVANAYLANGDAASALTHLRTAMYFAQDTTAVQGALTRGYILARYAGSGGPGRDELVSEYADAIAQVSLAAADVRLVARDPAAALSHLQTALTFAQDRTLLTVLIGALTRGYILVRYTSSGGPGSDELVTRYAQAIAQASLDAADAELAANDPRAALAHLRTAAYFDADPILLRGKLIHGYLMLLGEDSAGTAATTKVVLQEYADTLRALPQVGGGASSSPVVALTATPAWLAPGATTTLEWSTQHVRRCEGRGAWSGDLPLRGSWVVGPVLTDATYVLVCDNGAGQQALAATTVATRTATLNWSATAAAPPAAAAFRIEYGTTPGRYARRIDIANPSTRRHRLTLGPGTYYFQVSALAVDGSVVGRSNEATKTIN